MKHVLLITSLCLIATVAFAQKASVSSAERMAKDQRSNLNEARNLIKGAMENSETKDDPKTWFIAGQIEDAQFNRENTKQILGQQPNEPVMYEALQKAYPLFLKAYELDQRPNAKGKVAPKFVKNIKGILGANHVFYLNGGAYYYDQREYQKAYDFFEMYLEIANQPFFAGEKVAARDSNFMMVQFYSGVFATMMENPELAIKSLNRAKSTDYRLNEVYQYLIWQYELVKDSVSMEKTLEEGMKIFPDSSFYILNLINLYIGSDRNDKAIEMLTAAIAKDASNPQLYHAMGSVYESGLRDFEKSEEYYLKQFQLDQESAASNSNLGRIYYNQGIAKINDANQISDANQYAVEKEVAKGFFRKAQPYFEKAHQINPNEFDYMLALRGIYYQLEMTPEYEKMNAKMEER